MLAVTAAGPRLQCWVDQAQCPLLAVAVEGRRSTLVGQAVALALVALGGRRSTLVGQALALALGALGGRPQTAPAAACVDASKAVGTAL